MFEAKLEKLMQELGPGRFLAAYLATGARNGVEDLHVEGAFTDREAPTLNRSIRRAIYEAWLAMSEAVNEERDNAEQFAQYCWDVLDELEEWDATGDPTQDVLSAACHRAAADFMLEKGASDEDADEFAAAAMKEMRSYYRLWDRVVAGNASREEILHFGLAVGLIADCWEPADVSSEFAALLDE